MHQPKRKKSGYRSSGQRTTVSSACAHQRGDKAHLGTMARARHKAGVAVQLAGPVQTKVTIGRSGDRYEREADTVADRVNAGQQAPEISRIPPGGLRAQRQPDETESTSDEDVQQKAQSSEDKEGLVQSTGDDAGENSTSAQQIDTNKEETVQKTCQDCDERESVQQATEDEKETPSNSESVQANKESRDDDSEADAQEKSIQAQEETSSSSEQDDSQSVGDRAGETDEGSVQTQDDEAEGESRETGEDSEPVQTEQESQDEDSGIDTQEKSIQAQEGTSTSSEQEGSESVGDRAGETDEGSVQSQDDETEGEIQGTGADSEPDEGREADQDSDGEDRQIEREEESEDEAEEDSGQEAAGCGGETDGGEQEGEGGGESEGGGGGCGGGAENAAEEPAQAGEGEEAGAESDAESAGEEAANEPAEQDSEGGECNTDAQRQADEQEDDPVQQLSESSQNDTGPEEADKKPKAAIQQWAVPSQGQDEQEDTAQESSTSAEKSNQRPNRQAEEQKEAVAAGAIKNKCPGEPLDAGVRARLENAMGYDLGIVRLHTGTQAREISRKLKSKAFTHKNHIWLGPGQSPKDVKLLAHEMTHVIQQGGAQKRKDAMPEVGAKQATDKRDTDPMVDGNKSPEQGQVESAASAITIQAKTAEEEAHQENGSVQQQDASQAGSLPSREKREAAFPKKRLNKFQWPPGDEEVGNSAVELFINDVNLSERKKKQILSLIKASVSIKWRRFKSHVDDSGGIAALSTEEQAYVEAEKGHVKAAQKILTPTAKAPKKDQEGHALRHKSLKSMGRLLNDKYFVYWMFNKGTLLMWDWVSNESMVVDMDSYPESVASLASGPVFIKSVLRTEIFAKMASLANIDVEDVWLLLQPAEQTEEEPKAGEGDGGGPEKKTSLGGKFSKQRQRSLTRRQKQLRKKLPKSIRKSTDTDGLINLLDRLLAMPKEEREAFIKHLHQKAAAQKKEKKASPKKELPEKEDRIDPSKIADEIKAAKMVAESTKDQKGKPDPEQQKQVADLLAKLTDDERLAFLRFIEENKGKIQGSKPLDINTLYERYEKLSAADKEALRVKRMLGEQQTDPSKQLTAQDQKNVQVLVNKARANAKRYKANARSINKSINTLLAELDEGKAKSELKPLDPDEFEVMPEMIMLQGMMKGAGRMSPEIQAVANELNTQIGQIGEKLVEEIAWIAGELAMHAALSVVPLVGWLKTAATIGRLVQLGRKLNRLRKRLRALKKGYDVYQRVRAAVERARSIVVHARGFVDKFEAARRNWEFMRSQLEHLDATDDLDDRIELAYNQLMEQLQDKLKLIEPLMDKMYLPVDVREDPEKLLQVLFNLPQGIQVFSNMVDSYGDLGPKPDAQQLRMLFYKGMEAGILLYPLVGFVIGALSEALGTWLKKSKNLEAFLDRRSKWSRRSKYGSKTGKKLRSLWPRRMEYEGHTKKFKPQFKKHLDYAMGELQKEIPTPAPWKFRLRTYLRFWLRGFVKRLNRKGIKALGRRKGSKKPFRPVPIPKFRYKLRTKKGLHQVFLRINPAPNPRNIPVFDASVFDKKNTKNPRPVRSSKEGLSLIRWLEKNGYEIDKLPVIGRHIRLKGGKSESKKKRPYLLFGSDKSVQAGLESEDAKVIDRFINAKQTIVDSKQLPEGYYLVRKDTIPAIRSKSNKKVEYSVRRKRGVGNRVKQLSLDDNGKLKEGASKKRPEITLAAPAGAIDGPTVPDGKGRPKKAEGLVGYTVNKSRSGMPKKIPNMRKNDDRGHIVAARFNGSNKLWNLVPMNKDVNRKGDWYQTEASLARSYKSALKDVALDEKKKEAKAHVWINLEYPTNSSSRRPNKLDFRWEVKEDGKKAADGKMTTADNP